MAKAAIRLLGFLWSTGALCAALLCVATPSATLAATPSASQRVHVLLPLHADLRGLRRFTDRVTNPSSSSYGQFAPLPQLISRFGASKLTVAETKYFLRRHGATEVHVDKLRLLVSANMRRSVAVAMFGPGAVATGKRRPARSGRLSGASAKVPTALHGLVTGVIDGDRKSDFRSAARQASLGSRAKAHVTAPEQTDYEPATGTQSGCSAVQSKGVPNPAGPGGFTPNQYLKAYNYTALHNAGFEGQGQRVALIEIGGYDLSDLKIFAKCFGLSVPKVTTQLVETKTALPSDDEVVLDLEMLDAAAPKLARIDVYETSALTNAQVLDAMMAPVEKRVSNAKLPDAISISLGACEAAAGTSYLQTANESLELAAAAGVSVVVSAGDSGSAGCLSAADSTAPATEFPASSPWVTAVGGTNFLLTAGNTISDQAVWNDGEESPGSAGGGGYSATFAAPSYQSAVNQTSFRELPDISALADPYPGYDIYCTATGTYACGLSGWQTAGGTSAGTPLIAAGIALIDQALAKKGDHNLGFLNPLLYSLGEKSKSHADVFSDVTEGSNDVGPFVNSGVSSGCCSAVTGFDPASGWGSLDLGALDSYALADAAKLPTIKASLPAAADKHPYRSGGVSVTAKCSVTCSARGAATVTIGGKTAFTVRSGFMNLASTKTLKLRFSAAQRKLVGGGLHSNKKVSATILVSAYNSGDVYPISASKSLSLKITS